ncbi:ARMT1-like domain-containing protein [Pyrolobus fumarii]|uniref:ARMT1-like domain-containing protein n=1 Tax=Pyrolobus fumarii TaxID=54252 RepID=UPI0031342CAD
MSYEKYSEFLAALARLVAQGGRTRAFVESFVLIYTLAGYNNPNQEVKEKINRVMIEAAPLLLERLPKNPRLALEVSAAANAVDVEMLDYRFSGSLLEALSEKPEYRYTSADEVDEILSRAKRIAILLDNAGEAVVDLIVAARLVEHGKSVTLYARSKPYETDVTVDEVRELLGVLGLQLEVRGSGTHYPPHHPASEVRNELEEYDLVLAKGIANFETFLEAPLKTQTLSLLRAKCSPLARLFNVEKGKPIIVNPHRVPLRLAGRD